MAEAAIALAPGVWRIPTAPFDLVNTFAFAEPDGAVTLVDTGLRGAPARIAAGLAAIGRSPRDVTRIVLTHSHSDHGGGLARLSRETGATVAAHEADAGYVRRGERPPLDPSTGLGRMLSRGSAKAFDPVDVGHVLHDGEVLPVLGGLRVVHTPGHTPGHVSLLHQPTGVLITGDSIFNVLGLRWPAKAFCTDVALTRRTAHVLGQFEYRVAAFTHGPHVSDNAREKVRAFLTAAARR
ncbi:MBL fold metallo-hydrolase [Kineosporia sp. A_224]|uniref:MBL fold metallo-hydrolase n=1 Tax=Kineosporia sp. A_224 TaxID=1962180 RepID=UPI000B4A87C3|nr:MBL fold metallo-hydrolase [Kineosporia sp. A_224]